MRRGDLTHSVQGSVTKLKGAHTIKAGGDFRLFRYADLQAYDINLTFSFNRGWTQQDPYTGNALAGWGLASMLLGAPASGSTRIPASVAMQFYYGSAYIQDDWRVSSRLTLNLGFRYDIETPYTERYNRTSSFDPYVTNSATSRYPTAVGGLQFMGKDIASRYRNELDRNNFGPRVGLAYKFAPSFVLRAAYGIFYQPSLVYGYGQTQFGADGYDSTTPFVGSTDGGLTPSRYMSDPFPTIVQPLGNALGADTLLGRGITSQLRDPVIPYSQQYNLGIQYQIKSWLIDAGYVGSHSVKQPINLLMSQVNPQYMSLGNELRQQVANPFLGLVTAGTYANPTIAYSDLLKPFPHFTSVNNIFATMGHSSYNSLQARVERRFARGYSILAVYTWGKNIGNVGERYHVGNSIQNNYDLRAERALSPFDVAHRLVLSYLWELPFGKGKPLAGSLPKAVDLLVAGWQVNGITTFQSGTPLSVGLYSTNTCCGAGQRPNSTGISAKLPESERTLNRWLNEGAFSQPAPYAFGNTSWMSPELRGTPTNSWTVSLFKNTPIHERIQTQLRAEFFNFFNHPQWNSPGTSWGSPTYGRIFAKSGNRSAQLGLKVIF